MRRRDRGDVESVPDGGAEARPEVPPAASEASYAQLGAEVAQVLTSAKAAADSLLASARQEAAALRESTLRECDELLRRATERYERSAGHELELRRRIDAVEEAVVAMRSHLGSPSEVDDRLVGDTPTPSPIVPDGEAVNVWTESEADQPGTLPEVPPHELWTDPESGTLTRVPRSDLAN